MTALARFTHVYHRTRVNTHHLGPGNSGRRARARGRRELVVVELAPKLRSLDQALSDTKPEDLAETAKRLSRHGRFRVGSLHAANEYYTTAMSDLPNNRDVAITEREEGAELYERVARKPPRIPSRPVPRLFGKARCLEARNELSQAITQYELVASTWPGSPEAAGSQRIRGGTQKARSGCLLQRAVRVFSAQGHAAAHGQRAARTSPAAQPDGGRPPRGRRRWARRRRSPTAG